MFVGVWETPVNASPSIMSDGSPRPPGRGGRYRVSESLAKKRSAFSEHVGKIILLGQEHSRFWKALVVGRAIASQIGITPALGALLVSASAYCCAGAPA